MRAEWWIVLGVVNGASALVGGLGFFWLFLHLVGL